MLTSILYYISNKSRIVRTIFVHILYNNQINSSEYNTEIRTNALISVLYSEECTISGYYPLPNKQEQQQEAHGPRRSPDIIMNNDF